MLMLMLAFAIVILIGALLESSKVERRRKLAEQEHWDQDDDVVMLQSEDQSSSNIKNSNDDLVEYFGTSFRVVDDTAATDELQIEILNPKPKFQYSVTIEAPRKYTGTATMISSQHDGKMVYSWRPSFASASYVIIVHELERNRYGPHVKTPLVQPSPLSITIGTNQTEGLDSLKERAQRMVPCQSVSDMNVFSTFDGDWIGPAINVGGDTLRTRWTFVPSKTMNCKFEALSHEDVLSLPEKESIDVIGTSKERGVFLS